MDELICQEHQVSAHLGMDITPRLVFPTILQDGRQTVLPMLLRTQQSQKLIVAKWDQPGLEAGPPPPADVVYYGGYFTWNNAANPAPTLTLPEAIRAAGAQGRLRVDPVMAASQFQTVEAALPVELGPSAEPTTVRVFRMSRASVEAEMRQGYGEFVEKARPVVSWLRHGAELQQLLDGLDDPGFRVLDRLMGARQMDVLLVTSPFQVEEFTAIPRDHCRWARVSALYRRDEQDVYLIVESAWQPPGAEPVGSYGSWLAAVTALTGGGSLGYEELHLSAGRFVQVRERVSNLMYASMLIRQWQERKSGGNLAYYALAGNACTWAMRRTLDYASRRLRESALLTEMELRDAFNSYVAEFALQVGLPGNIRPYFWVIHSGERSLMPAAPTYAPLTLANKTIKLDMGTQVFDHAGRVRGCTDLALTLGNTPELASLHQLLNDLVLDRIIPNIRAGMTGEEVHRVGVGALKEHEAQIRAWGQLPPNVGVEGYVRDCGHSITRQSYCSIHFKPGDTDVMEQDMCGCVEYLWPYNDACLAIEHAYIVTESGAIPTTA